MVHPDDDPGALKQLQDAIYRDKVRHARAMTGEQRLAEVFRLSNSAFQRMLEGAMWQLATEDRGKGWLEVGRRLDRLRRVHDEGRFVTERNPRR